MWRKILLTTKDNNILFVKQVLILSLPKKKIYFLNLQRYQTIYKSILPQDGANQHNTISNILKKEKKIQLQSFRDSIKKKMESKQQGTKKQAYKGRGQMEDRQQMYQEESATEQYYLMKEKLSTVINFQEYLPKSIRKISRLLNNLVHSEVSAAQQTKKNITEVAKQMILQKISLPEALLSEKKQKQEKQYNIIQLQNTIKSMQAQIKSMAKTPKLQKQISQKVSTIEVQRKKIEDNNKVQIKYGQQPNDMLIFCQNLCNQKINNFINSLFASRKSVEVTFEKIVKKLRGGADGQPQAKVHIKVNIENLIAQLLDQSKKIQRILAANSLVKNEFSDILFDFIKQIQQKSNEIKSLSKQLKNLAINHKDMLEYEKENNIDVVIVMDTTGSMAAYLEQAKIDSINIMKMFKQKYPKTNLRFGFISYKDHCDSPVLKTYDLNEDAAFIQEQIQQQSAHGGGDTPQAVHDGLYAAGTLNWRTNSQKFVILIADAPPHGRQYWSGNDNYPKGCKCGITLKQIAAIYKKLRINFTLKAIGSFLGKTNTVFQSNFQIGYYQFGEIKQAEDYALSSVNYLQQKMKVIREKSKTLQESLAKLAQQLVEKVKEQAKTVIEQSQKMKEVVETEQNRNELKNYFDTIKQIASQSKPMTVSTSSLDKTISTINTALKLKAKIEEVKKIKEKIKLMTKSDLSQMKSLLESEITRWRAKGSSNQKIINNLVDVYDVDESMARLLTET